MKIIYKIPIPYQYRKMLKSGKPIPRATKRNIERRIKREVVELYTRECLQGLHSAINSCVKVRFS